MESLVMGDKTWVYKFTPELKRKPHDLERSSFTHYKKNSKLSHLREKQWRLCFGIVKASCCVMFSHQKQQSAATNTTKLLKNLRGH
jgi:hypothetical protein